MKIGYSLLIVVYSLSGALYAGQLDSTIILKLNELDGNRVILLGEPTHGEGNVFEYKTDIVKYLHDSMGYNVIAFESGFYDLYRANELTKANATVNSNFFLSNSILPIWTRSEQFQSFFEYYEKKKDGLQIAGFDLQFSGSYSLQLIDSVSVFIANKDPLLKIDRDLISEVMESIADSEVPTENEYTHVLNELNRIIHFFDSQNTSKLLDAEKKRSFYYRRAMINFKVLVENVFAQKDIEMDEATYKAEYSNRRDSMMADNLLALLTQFPDEKVICWGAGTHFMYDPSHVNKELQRYKPMGMYLQNRLGKDAVFNLSFITTKGAYGAWHESAKQIPKPDEKSIENYLFLNNSSPSLIRLNEPPFENTDWNSSILEYTPVTTDWGKLFDAVIYLPEFTKSTPAVLSTPKETKQMEAYIPKIAAPERSTIGNKYMGKVLDQDDKSAVPFVSIILIKSKKEIITDKNGEFLVRSLPVSDSAVVFCEGYQLGRIKIDQLHDNIIYLTRLKQELKGVTLTAKKMLKVNDIIADVKQHWSDNYYQGLFSHEVYLHQSFYNFDSNYLNIDYVSDLIYNMTPNHVEPEYRGRRVNIYDSATVDEVGYSFMRVNQVLAMDLINREYIFKNKRYKRYRYELKEVLSDSSQGLLYRIKFTPRSLKFKYSFGFYIESMTGELLVREKDFAIISAKYEVNRDSKLIRKFAYKYSQSGKVDKYTFNIAPDSAKILLYCRYRKDTLLNKYFMDYGDFTYSEVGQVVSSGKSIAITEHLLFYSLNRVKILNNISESSYGKPKVKLGKEFWDSSTLPRVNEIQLKKKYISN